MDGLHSLFLFVCLMFIGAFSPPQLERASVLTVKWCRRFWLVRQSAAWKWTKSTKITAVLQFSPPFQPSLPDHYVLENHLKLLWPPLLSLQANLEHTFTAAPFIYTTSDSISVIPMPAQLSTRGVTVTPSSLPEAPVTPNPVEQWEATVSCLRTHIRLLEDVIVLPQFEVGLQWPKVSFSFFRNA